MIKIFITLTLLLSTVAVPWFKSNDNFKPGIWAATVAQNHRTISNCYGYIVDNNFKTFSQACDITTLVIIENSVIKEFNDQHNKYPNLSRHDFLSLYYSPKTVVLLSSHFDHQIQFNMTLMILMISETIINSHNTEDPQ